MSDSMPLRPLGSSGIDASVIAFGAWAIGGWKWGGTDAMASINAIHASLDAGVNFIDTAAVYGFGLSEELVGKAMQGRARDSIVLATKCGLRWDLETDTLHAESEGKRICRTLAADSVRHEIDQSLQRLGTDYIDLYQTHWPDPATDIDEVMSTLVDLKHSGKIRAIGLCNSTPDALSRAAGSGELHVDQERYSLLDRERESDNLPLVRNHQLAFLAYSPIAQGLLTGQVGPDREFPDSDLRRNNPRFSQAARQAVQALLEPVAELAADRGVTIEQLVLAWTLNQAGVSHVLVGTRSVAQAEANAVAGGLVLSDSEQALISEAASTWHGFPS